MSGTFDNVDLSALPAPAAVQTFSFDAIVTARLADFATRWAAQQLIDPTLPNYNVSSLETDPSRMLEETGAYREGLVTQRINDAVLATSLAYATGNDLIVRAADYGTAPKPGESQASLRKRAQLAWENLSLGGSYGGYTYRALGVAPTEIADVMVYGHEIPQVPKGCVYIVVLGATTAVAGTSSLVGQVTPTPALLALVQAAFAPRTSRKVNDRIVVVAANVISYTVDATLLIKPGADAATVVTAQTAAVRAYATARQQITGLVTPSHVIGQLVTATPDLVVDCVLRQPAASVGGGPFDVPVCTGIRVVSGVAA